MPSTSFGEVRLIPVWAILNQSAHLPTGPGIYLFLAKGGHELLSASAYYNCGGLKPKAIRKHVHLYTGAARRLGDRLKQHIYSDIECSSLRKSLLALQKELGAISATKTPQCKVQGELTLTAWLSANGMFAVIENPEPFRYEEELLSEHPSPFNIVHRRQARYARLLSAIRCMAFPANAKSHRKLRRL